MLLEIYRICFPQARHHILSNSGNEYDAEDVFQDALLVVYYKVRNNSLTLNSSFNTYLLGIVKFLWLKELQRKKNYFGIPVEMADPLYDEYDFLEDYFKMEKRKLIFEHYSDLSPDCQRILDLYLKETPINRITLLMGYSSDQYTKNRRTSCKERLIWSIWNNPKFKELKNEAYRQDTKVPRW